MQNFKFSEGSKKKLEECHPDLQHLFNEVICHYNCQVICGYRGEKEQMEAFESGHSKILFPYSKHNKTPSMAVDVVPLPINWSNREGFIHFVGFVKGVAAQLGINIRCGLDFNNNLNFKDDKLFDAPHFELI